MSRRRRPLPPQSSKRTFIAALPLDVRLGFALPSCVFLNEAMPHDPWRHSLVNSFRRNPERQSLSTHQAAKPETNSCQ